MRMSQQRKNNNRTGGDKKNISLEKLDFSFGYIHKKNWTNSNEILIGASPFM